MSNLKEETLDEIIDGIWGGALDTHLSTDFGDEEVYLKTQKNIKAHYKEALELYIAKRERLAHEL